MELNLLERDHGVLDFTPLPAGRRFHVLFVYPNVQRVHTPQLGLASLSACVKRIGGTTALFDITDLAPGAEVAAFEAALAAEQPDLVGFSVRSNEWVLTREMIDVCRRHRVRTVVGGPHATYASEDAITAADWIVVGEGEGAMMDLVRALATGGDVSAIANVWTRRGDAVTRNAKRRLIENLDDVPLPDWRLFGESHYRESYMRHVRPGTQIVAAIEGSRGCPFTCTYCSNERLMREYHGHGTWRREKSPARMVAELEAFRAEYGRIDFVYWVDEIWLTRVARLAEFRDRYKASIGAAFSIMERPECVTEEKIAIIADAGLYSIAIGLETGDDELRTRLLDRRTARDVLVRAFTLPKRHGVKVHAFTMLGLPGQDERSMLETWRFLREAMPTSAQFSIFYPLRGTKLYDQTVAAGLYDPSNDMTDYYSGSPLRQPGIDNALVRKYQRLFEWYATRPGPWAAIQFHLSRRFDACDRAFMAVKRARMHAGAVRRKLRAAARAGVAALIARGGRRACANESLQPS